MTFSNMPLPTEKMVLVLILLLGILGGGVGRVRFLTWECLILLDTPILVPIVKVLPDTWTGKKLTYDKIIWEVERACFSLLVFAPTGGMGPSATTVFRKFACMLADKWNVNYSRCLFWIRCRLCFPSQIWCDVLKRSLIIYFPSNAI